MSETNTHMTVYSLFDPPRMPERIRKSRVIRSITWFLIALLIVFVAMIFWPSVGNLGILSWGPLCYALIQLLPILFQNET